MISPKTESKSKTFQKGDDAIPDILDFVMKNIETTDYEPEGANDLTPSDLRQDLNWKYTVTVTRYYIG